MTTNIHAFLTSTFGESVVAIPIPDYKKYPSDLPGWQTYTGGLKSDNPTTYGINCGLSNLVVIDLDVHNENEDGIKSFKNLLREYNIEKLDTFTVRTGSGGLHLYFKYEGDDIKNTVGKTGIRDGIDVRANGGQVVGVFSTVKQKDGSLGEYTIAKNSPVMDLPEWLAEECRNAMSKNKRKSIPRAASTSAIAPDEEMDNYAKAALANCIIDVSSAVEGSRNDTLARASFGAAAAGVPVETVVDSLTNAARVNGMDEREIQNTVRRCAEQGALEYVPREKSFFNSSKKQKQVEPKDIEKLVKGVPEDVAERIRRDASADVSDLLDDDQLTEMFIAQDIQDRALYLDSLKQWFYYNEEIGIWEAANGDWARVPADKFLSRRKTELREAEINAKTLNSLTTNYKLFNVASRAKVRLQKQGAKKDHFNQDNDTAVFADGVIDLRTGEFKEFSPEVRSTQRSRTPLRLNDPTVDKSKFAKVLAALPDDAVEYVQMAFGCGLTGHQSSVEPAAIFFNGSGADGKSALFATTEVAAGDYAGRPLSTVFEKNADLRFAMRGFEDLRLAIFEELPEAHFLNAVSVKRLIGTGSTSTDVKFGDEIKVRMAAQIVVSTNFLPTVTETDDGTWRRLVALNMTKKFRRNPDPNNPNHLEADPYLASTNLETLSPTEDIFTAALQWMVEGAIKFYANGRKLPELPESIKKATDHWRDNNDRMANWANTYFEEGTNDEFVLSSDVFDCYHYHLMTIEKAKSALNQTNFWSQFVEHRWFLSKGLEKKRDRVGKKMKHSEWSNPVKRRTDFGYLPARPTGDKVMMVRGIKFRDPEVDYDPAEAKTLVEDSPSATITEMDDYEFELDENIEFDEDIDLDDLDD